MRRSPALLAAILLAAVVLAAGVGSAAGSHLTPPPEPGDPGANPAWNRDPGDYRYALNHCGGDATVVRWQLVMAGDDPAERWEDAVDHRVHTFTMGAGREHWNVEPTSIESEVARADGTFVVTWKAAYPNWLVSANRPTQVVLDQAWVELGSSERTDSLARPSDQLRLLATAPCTPRVNASAIDRWAATAGNPDVLPAPR